MPLLEVGKPHIIRITHTHNCSLWECRGASLVQYGHSPRDAYEAWAWVIKTCPHPRKRRMKR